MKIAAPIFLCLFMFIMVQPLLASISEKNDDCCTEKSCKNERNKGNDENKNCNPLVSCSLCNLFFVSKFYVSSHHIIQLKEKVFVENDNRTIKNLSNCWHPPQNIIA